MLKYAFNLIDDGLVGQQVFAGEATRLAYMTDEAVEGRDSFLEKRDARLVARTPGTTEQGHNHGRYQRLSESVDHLGSPWAVAASEAAVIAAFQAPSMACRVRSSEFCTRCP